MTDFVTDDNQVSHYSGSSQTGRWLGPVLACLLAVVLKTQTEIPGPALATACIVVLMAIWWITEAIPLAATAMLPLALFPIFGVGEKLAVAPQIDQSVTWDLDNPRYGEPLAYAIKSDNQRTDTGQLIELANQHGVVKSSTGQVTVPIRFIRAIKPASLFEVTSRSYASKFVFLMMGGFLLGMAIERWNLHRRIALTTILALGTEPVRPVSYTHLTLPTNREV